MPIRKEMKQMVRAILGKMKYYVTLKPVSETIRQIIGQNNELIYAKAFESAILNADWLKDRSFSLVNTAANYSFAYILFKALEELGPKSILELGLGQTSRLTTQYVSNKNRDCRLDIIEHEPGWIEFFGKKLELGAASIKIHRLELEQVENKGFVNVRYAEMDKAVQAHRYDLIIVDGPNRLAKGLARSNILELIREHLAEDFIIIVDNVERKGVQNTAQLLVRKMKEAGIECSVSFREGTKKQMVLASEKYKLIHWL